MKTALKNFMQSRVDDGYYTQDTPTLYRRAWHPIFVYGTLREGFSRGIYLEDCPKVGTGFTRGSQFRMYNLLASHRAGSKAPNYPVILPEVTPEHAGKIYGEVYLVSPDTLKNLDFIESNGIQYKRSFRVIELNTRQNNGEVPTLLTCWVYAGSPAAWNACKNNGSLVPLPHHMRDDSKYYVYKKTDQCIAA